ncbi:MAG: PAS domain S-box protein [Methanoregula sp.]|nr:PAS domain S-box protein [Methanoregula sp.]
MNGQEPPGCTRIHEESFVNLWHFIIVSTIILALLINILALRTGNNAVAPHLLYIPIVIAAYWYPKQGVYCGALVCALYLGIVYFITDGAPADLLAAGVICLVILGIAAVVSRLSLDLRSNEIKYRGIFTHSEAGIGLITGKDKKIQEVNRRFAVSLGYDPAEPQAIDFSRIWFDPADRDRFFGVLDKNGSMENFETRFVTKAGTTRWVLLSAGILPDDQIVCTMVDITAKIKAEESLLVKDHAIHSSINAIAIMDLGFNISYVNPSLVSLAGYRDAQEFSGKNIKEYIVSNAGFDRMRDSILNNGSWFGEIQLFKYDRTPFYVLLWGNLVKDESGKPLCTMVSFIDITDKKQLESVKRKALEQIEKNIEQFAILGDHIRNPLAVIVGLSSLAPGEVTDKIILQAREIDRIVSQLDMGWIESEKVREFIRRYYMVGAGQESGEGTAQQA